MKNISELLDFQRLQSDEYHTKFKGGVNMKFTTTAPDRRTLIRAIAEHTNSVPKYAGPPSFAYTAGDITIDRDGEVDVPDEQAQDLKAFLVTQGWMVPDPEPEPTIIKIGYLAKDMTVRHMTNLIHMLYSKQDLLAKAQGCSPVIRIEESVIQRLREDMPANLDEYAELLRNFEAQGDLQGIELSDGQVKLSYPMLGDGVVWAILSTRIVETAKTAHWVFSQRVESENEKYYMRSWLLRLGMGGADFKADRAALLKNLKGCTAFPDSTKAQEHKERWKNIRHEQRQHRLEQEVDSDDNTNA